MDKKIIKVLNELQIPKWFPDYNIDLFYLAFMPPNPRFHTGPVYDRLKELYPYAKDISYDVLEFYGDTVLYMMIIDIFRDFCDIRSVQSLMDKTKRHVASNEYVRGLSHKKGICDTVYGIKTRNRLQKHNYCSDSFEALIGALYVQYGLAGLEKITQWFIDTFPDLLNDIRKRMAPYIYIPVRDVYDDEEDIIARFQELNPRCKIVNKGRVWSSKIKAYETLYEMHIDGLKYDENTDLSSLIPIIRHDTLDPVWQKKRYSNLLLDDETYICQKGPSVYMCDATSTNRVSRYNPRVRSCRPVPATGACNIATDKLYKYAKTPDESDPNLQFTPVVEGPDLLERFMRLNSHTSFTAYDGDETYMFINGNFHDSSESLDSLIPILPASEDQDLVEPLGGTWSLL